MTTRPRPAAAGRWGFAGAVLTLILLGGCLAKEEEPPREAAQKRRAVATRQFDTMEVRCDVVKLIVKPNGSAVHHSTDTLTFLVDAVNNRSRYELTATHPKEYELQIFDERMWTVVPSEKAIYPSDPPWPRYKVWDQVWPGWGVASGHEPLRGLETEVYKNEKGTYWYYKGVPVQSERPGKKYIIRITLRDLKENVPIPAGAFRLPDGYRKIEY